MKKYICTVKAIITTTKEVTDTIEIEAPDGGSGRRRC